MLVEWVQLNRKDGATIDWPIVNVSALLKWHYECNSVLSDAMVAAVKANPNKSLRLIPFSDEFTPGNVLHPEQRKKCNVLGVSV